jgi:sulfite reductase alpha subunit-like flavoprotein
LPIIMVGPGTGLAPFRAFITHRALGGVPAGADGAADGEAVLYFGCRHQAKDCLYGARTMDGAVGSRGGVNTTLRKLRLSQYPDSEAGEAALERLGERVAI